MDGSVDVVLIIHRYTEYGMEEGTSKDNFINCVNVVRTKRARTSRRLTPTNFSCNCLVLHEFDLEDVIKACKETKVAFGMRAYAG